MRRTLLVGGAALVVAAAAVAGAGTAAALAPAVAGAVTTPDDPSGPERQLAGGNLDRAIRAALAHTGGGTVTDSETGDGGAAYGVEVRTPDGRHVEVRLDSGFGVVGEEADEHDSG